MKNRKGRRRAAIIGVLPDLGTRAAPVAPLGLWAFSGDAANNKSALPSHKPLIWTDGLEKKLPPCLKLKTIIYYLSKETVVITKKK